MAKVVYDESVGIDLLKERQRSYEPFVSVKKSGLVKFNAGLQLIIGGTNMVDKVLGYPDTIKMVIVLEEKNDDPMGDPRTPVRTKRTPSAKINPKTGQPYKQKLGELSMKSHLIQSKLLPLKGKHTEMVFKDGTGLTVDTESEEGRIVIELDGNKGVLHTNAKVGSP